MDVIFEVNNSQLFIEVTKAVFYVILILAKILLSVYAMRNRFGRGSTLMVIGSLGVLVPGFLSFVTEYWYVPADFLDMLYTLMDVLSLLTNGAFVLGLYYFIIDSEKTSRLPMKEDGLS